LAFALILVFTLFLALTLLLRLLLTLLTFLYLFFIFWFVCSFGFIWALNSFYLFTLILNLLYFFRKLVEYFLIFN
jgi:hypothetical protein